jgi:hypothetical protein
MLYKDLKPGQQFIFKGDTDFLTRIPVYEKRVAGFVSLCNPSHLHDDEVLFNAEEVYLLKCGL